MDIESPITKEVTSMIIDLYEISTLLSLIPQGSRVRILELSKDSEWARGSRRNLLEGRTGIVSSPERSALGHYSTKHCLLIELDKPLPEDIRGNSLYSTKTKTVFASIRRLEVFDDPDGNY